MLIHEFEPRFNDTDALGHISNTAFPGWLEDARTPIFNIFHPSKDVKTWPLILARTELDFLAQSYWGSPVEIKTCIVKLGSSSCHVEQEVWQRETLVAKGLAIMVHFDYQTNTSKAIPDDIRQQLLPHLKD